MRENVRMKVMAMVLIIAVALTEPLSIPLIGNIEVANAATVKISESILTMKVAETTTLKVTGTNSKVTWRSSNENVATVTSKGVVTAQSIGTANITATIGEKNYICTITVIPLGNPYLTTTDLKEIQLANLSFVIPNIYEVSGDEIKDTYIANLTIPDSKSGMLVLADKTGKKASSYVDVAASLEDVNLEDLQESMDATYGSGVALVSDFSTFAYEAKNGTKSFGYSYMLTKESVACRMISYKLSIDDYYLQIIAISYDGYDIRSHAECLIDSLMYIE